MPEQQTERIVLMVDAPSDRLKSSDSGLNVALRKLGAIDRLLRQVESRYQRIASMRLPGTGPGAFPPGAGHGPLFMTPQAQAAAQDGMKAAAAGISHATLAAGHRIKLEIPAQAINAHLAPANIIKLQIQASQIQAEVIGQVQAKVKQQVAAAGGTGGTGTPGGGAGGGIPPIGGPGGVISSKIVRRDGEEILRELKVAQDKFASQVQTVQRRTSGDKVTETITDEKRTAAAGLGKLRSEFNLAAAQVQQELDADLKKAGTNTVAIQEAKAKAFDKTAKSMRQVLDQQGAAVAAGGKALDVSKLEAQAAQMQTKATEAGIRAQQTKERQAKATANAESKVAQSSDRSAKAAERQTAAQALRAEKMTSHERLRTDLLAAGSDKAMKEQALARHQGRMADAAAKISGPLKDEETRSRMQLESAEARTRATQKEVAAIESKARAKRSDERATAEQIAREEKRRSRGILRTDLAKAGEDKAKVALAKAGHEQRMATAFGTLAGAVDDPNTRGVMLGRQSGHQLEAQKRMNDHVRHFAKNIRTGADEVSRFSDNYRELGKNLLQNVKHVTQWAASVTILYGSLRLVGHAMSTMIDTGYQVARLQQVFRGVGGTARQLAYDVIGLAAAHGREREEALQSAIAWSRLGLTRQQVNEAVRVSLLAANVAEISAAEATEHLSSLMQVYKLRVSELNGVLGILNHVSNTFNVTNKEMLTGLTRTSAIAQQAGISLAELIGIIGAGVGTTGQSGPNIANALKAVIGSLSSIEKQKALRENFRIEVTAEGGEDMKNMSDLLAEIFVRYQAMNSAERRSMLFTVAGKHQASRLAAVLDSYVRSQVLAISGQLNLNSAQEENALIMETLRNQLQGLVTEWEKFASIQGGRTVAPALKETVLLMHNALSLFNSPTGSLVATGMVGLFAAISAKLVLTAFSMSEVSRRGGIIANTIKAIKVAWIELRGVMNAAALGQGRVSQHMPFIGMLGGTSGQLSTKITRDAAGNVQKIALVSNAATTGMVNLSRAGRLAAISMAAFVDVLLPLLAIYGAIKLINMGIEAVGLSSDKAESHISKLVQQAEQANKAAEGARLGIRLMSTVREGYQNARTPEARTAILTTAAEAAFLDRPAKEAKKLQKELKQNFALWVETNDQAAINAKLTELSSQAAARQARERQREFEFIERERMRLNQEIKRLKSSPFDRSAKIQEFEAQLYGLGDRKTTLILTEIDEAQQALTDYEQTSVRHQTLLKAQQGIVEALRHAYTDLPGDTHMDRLQKEIMLQQELTRTLDRQADAIMARRRSRGMADETAEEMDAQVRARRSELMEQRSGLMEGFRSDFQRITQGEFGFGGTLSKALQTDDPQAFVQGLKEFVQWSQQVDLSGPTVLMRNQAIEALRAFEALRAKEMELETLREQASKARTSDEQKALDAQLAAVRKARDDARASHEALKADPELKRLAELADRRSATGRLTRAFGDSFSVGETRGDQLLSKVTALDREVAARLNSPVEQQRYEALVLLQEATEARLQLEERSLEISKEEKQVIIEKGREFQKALLGAGPAEMLRKLAISRFTQGGTRALGAGELFALSGGARQDYFQTPAGDPRLRELRGEADRLRNAGFGDRSKAIEAYVAAAEARRGLQQGLGPEINAQARDAALSMGNLNQVVQVATEKFGTLASEMDRTIEALRQRGFFAALPDQGTAMP
jgi:TP901 family phage tail tape measure protein